VKEVPILFDSEGVPRPAFTVAVQLASVSFELSFRWNARAAAWIFSMKQSGTSEDIVTGIPVRTNGYLYRFLRSGMPLGMFYVLDTSGAGEDPGRDELGGRVRIYFLEAGEL
jgi:hypothetical protein